MISYAVACSRAKRWFFCSEVLYTEQREYGTGVRAHTSIETRVDYIVRWIACMYACVYICLYDVECCDAYFNGTNTNVCNTKIARRIETIPEIQFNWNTENERFIHQMQSM